MGIFSKLKKEVKETIKPEPRYMNIVEALYKCLWTPGTRLYYKGQRVFPKQTYNRNSRIIMYTNQLNKDKHYERKTVGFSPSTQLEIRDAI